MKLLLVLGLAFGAINSLALQAKERNEVAAIRQKPKPLEVTLIAPKHKYARNEKLNLHVMLNNPSNDYIYVFGTLEWGYSASLLLHVRDSSGKEIEPVGFPDERSYASPDDQSAFVKLPPKQFIGTDFTATPKFLNLTKPGKYTVFVEYNSPFLTSEVKLIPFWGKDSGTIKSNVVTVEILR